MKIVFATGNVHKLREAQEILGEGYELVTPASLGITEEIPETGDTLEANSLQKAMPLPASLTIPDWKWMLSVALREYILPDMPNLWPAGKVIPIRR